jgi:hypothetical protein
MTLIKSLSGIRGHNRGIVTENLTPLRYRKIYSMPMQHLSKI